MLSHVLPSDNLKGPLWPILLLLYPASTVKLPTALVALEKLNELGIAGLDKFTHLKVDSAYSRQSAVTTDSTAADGLPSIAHYSKKFFLVSDNDAYNRLDEYPDGYAKFFLYGDTKERIPQHIRLQSEPTSTKKTEAGLR